MKRHFTADIVQMTNKHMNIKTPIAYRYDYQLSVKMAKIKNSRSANCWDGCAERGLSQAAGGKWRGASDPEAAGRFL